MSRLPTPVVVALIVVAGLLGLGVITSLTIVVLFAPDGTDLPALIAAVAAAVVAIGTGTATLLKQRGTDARVAGMAESVHYLANGGTDAKMRAGIADVIPERMLKPEYVADQLEADRAHRDATPAPHPAAVEAAEALLLPHLEDDTARPTD